MRIIILIAALLGPFLTGCARFPEVAASASKEVMNAAYPTLVPLGPLLANAPANPETDPAAEAQARAVALRARAARLRQTTL